MREVYRLIRSLGMTSKYKGYYYLADAIWLTMEYREQPLKITKDVYPKLARKYKSTPMNIEHDIRTLINVGWLTNRNRMEEIAGYTLYYKPTNSEFIDFLAYYLSQQEETGTGKSGL